MRDFSYLEGFNWDKGNINKNWTKHQVSNLECEEVFFNQPLLVYFDRKHSRKEARYYVLGQTSLKRLLFLVFTIRNRKIRIISARDMSRKERQIYEKAKKNSEV
ncbi:BrnT family toxin [bacterium]|nr:BrnT family toxin [bacterium]